MPTAPPPSSGALAGKVNVKFRCLMVALTGVVACIMAFNVFWLASILEEGDSHRHRNHRRRGHFSRTPADLDYQQLDYEGILKHEVKPHCVRRRTIQDIQSCFPWVRKLPTDCQDIRDWSSVQRCLTGRFRPDSKVQHIHIVGERHSGTKFLTQELQACFPRKTRFPFRVHRDFIRSKHFFQPILAGHDLATSFIIVVVRDPVDWVAAMHEKPYHSPNHVAALNETAVVPLDWQDFVTRPWTLSGNDWEAKPAGNNDEELCQDSFHRNEVVPCEYDEESGKIIDRWVRGFAPLYEMQRDGTGRPFSSILELRTEKILNFILELPMLTDLSGFMIVRYEDLLRNGTQFVLDQLRDRLGLPPSATAKCHVQTPQTDRLDQRRIPEDFRQYIRQHLDADMERLLGYD